MGVAGTVKHPWDIFSLKAEVSGSGKSEVIAERLYLEAADSAESPSSFVWCRNYAAHASGAAQRSPGKSLSCFLEG